MTLLASQHDVRGFDVFPLEEEQIEDFERKLTNEMNKKKRELDNIKVNFVL